MAAYLIPAGLEPHDIAARLASFGAVEAGAPRTERRTYLDSFDWRLHRAGWLLEAVGGRRPLLRLRPLDGGGAIAAQHGGTTRFARELPAGPLREKLEPVLEPRALLPIAVADVTCTSLTLLGERGRAPLRLTLETTLV